MRHGESLANEKNILASRQDFSLSPKGKRDAGVIALEFTQKIGPLTGILSSPLSRARETAAPFCRISGLELEIEESVIEQELGDYAGMTYFQIEKAPGYEHDRTRRWDWIPSGGGESYSMIADRLIPFFEGMEKKAIANPGGALLVVTHAVTMRLIRASLETTLPQYPQEIAKNGEIWEVDYTRAQIPYKLTVHLLGDAGNSNSRA